MPSENNNYNRFFYGHIVTKSAREKKRIIKIKAVIMYKTNKPGTYYVIDHSNKEFETLMNIIPILGDDFSLDKKYLYYTTPIRDDGYYVLEKTLIPYDANEKENHKCMKRVLRRKGREINDT